MRRALRARAAAARAAAAPCSIAAASASAGTSNGSPIDERDGRERLGNLRAVPAAAASSGGWLRDETAAPDCRSPSPATPRPAARRAPARAGRRRVNPAGLPAAMSRVSCSSALRAAARRRSARRAVAEALDDAGNPLAVEVLAGDDDDAAAAEVVGGRQNAPVPERHDRLAAAARDRVEVLETFGLPAQRRAERGDQPVADGGNRARPGAASSRDARQSAASRHARRRRSATSSRPLTNVIRSTNWTSSAPARWPARPSA